MGIISGRPNDNCKIMSNGGFNGLLIDNSSILAVLMSCTMGMVFCFMRFAVLYNDILNPTLSNINHINCKGERAEENAAASGPTQYGRVEALGFFSQAAAHVMTYTLLYLPTYYTTLHYTILY